MKKIARLLYNVRMNAYRIIPVQTKKDIKRFMRFPFALYEGNPYWVPLLQSDERKIFKPSYSYNETCDTVFFLCLNDKDEVVGRVEGIIQRAANAKWNQKRVRFTRFDCIDDQEVANLLLDAVASWGKQKGMDELVGPLGYSDFEREGLLIEGFDQPQTYEEQYNHDYYQRLLETYGLAKEVDWLEYHVSLPEKKDPRIKTLADRAKARYGLTFYQPKKIGSFVKEYKEQFFELVDDTYNKIYGTVPFTEKMMNEALSAFKLILRPQDLAVVFNAEKKMVGFALMFPSISKVVAKHKGKITPLFLIEFLKNKKHPEVIDFGLIGVRPEYMMQGVAGILVDGMTDTLIEAKVSYFETNLMLEENLSILGFMGNFPHEQVKKRRCFVKKL